MYDRVRVSGCLDRFVNVNLKTASEDSLRLLFVPARIAIYEAGTATLTCYHCIVFRGGHFVHFGTSVQCVYEVLFFSPLFTWNIFNIAVKALLLVLEVVFRVQINSLFLNTLRLRVEPSTIDLACSDERAKWCCRL